MFKLSIEVETWGTDITFNFNSVEIEKRMLYQLRNRLVHIYFVKPHGTNHHISTLQTMNGTK